MSVKTEICRVHARFAIAFFGMLFAALPTCAAAPSGTATYLGMSSGTYGFDRPDLWSNGISPTNEASANYDYILLRVDGSKNNSMRGPETRPTDGLVTVYANSFTIGQSNVRGDFRDCRTSDWALEFANDGLVLLRGAFYRDGGRHADGELRGSVTVTAPTSRPFNFYGSNNAHGGYRMTGKWTSNSNTAIKFYSVGDDTTTPFFTVQFLGDMSDFGGQMLVESNTCHVLMNGSTLPGTVNVSANATFGAVAASNVVTVGTLDLADGARLHLPVDNAKSEVASVRVTSAFSSDGTAGIVLSALPKMSGGTKVPLLTLVSGCSGTIGDGELSVSLQDGSALPAKFELVVESDPSTEDTVLWLSAKQTGLVISFR